MKLIQKCAILTVMIVCCLVLTQSVAFAQDKQEKGFWGGLFSRGEQKTEGPAPITKTEPIVQQNAPEPVSTVEVTPPQDDSVLAVPDVEGVTDEGAQTKVTFKTGVPKQDMIDGIKANLMVWRNEITDIIGDLVETTDDKGNVIYKFRKSSGELVFLEELDEGTLAGLFSVVNNAAINLQSQRIHRDQAQIQRAHEAQRVFQQQQATQTQQTMSAQQVHSPPQVPQTAQTPQAYSPPPTVQTPQVYHPPTVHAPPKTAAGPPPTSAGPPPGASGPPPGASGPPPGASGPPR